MLSVTYGIEYSIEDVNNPKERLEARLPFTSASSLAISPNGHISASDGKKVVQVALEDSQLLPMCSWVSSSLSCTLSFIVAPMLSLHVGPSLPAFPDPFHRLLLPLSFAKDEDFG